MSRSDTVASIRMYVSSCTIGAARLQHCCRTAEPGVSEKSRRYREIVTVLARHGFRIVDGELFHKEDKDHLRAEQLRLACEELGTMAIKLGQMLSTRSNILSEPYRQQLSKLQSDVPPVPTQIIEQVIQQSLGESPQNLYAYFDEKPLGSASIGQVHAARLKDGRSVVVKVRKPGVDHQVDLDLEIVGELIDRWSKRFPVLVEYNARELLRDFGDTLREEMQYTREASNIEFFRNFFRNDEGFAIPEVIADLSKGSVLTETEVYGKKVSDIKDRSPERRKVIAQRIADFVLQPTLKTGTFHADPHAGNLFVEDDDKLAVIDFGKVGRLTPQERRSVGGVFLAVGRIDAERLTDSLLEITNPNHPVDRAALSSDIGRMLVQYVDVSIGSIHFGDAMRDLLVLVRKNGLYLPGHIVLFFKALAMSEGLLETVDPDASFTDYLKPFIGRLLFGGFTGKDGAERFRSSAMDALELAIELPRRIGRVLAEVERGNVRVWTRIEDADSLMSRLEHLVARMNATILAAASIIGLAVVMQFYHPRRWQTWIGIVFWIFVGVVLIDYIRTLLNLKSKG